MSTQCSVVSLTGSNLHPSPTHYRQAGSEGCDNAAAFERFLCWLGPDPETAGLKYESIRSRLIMMFRARRCVFAEDLADATFERVARKLNALANKFTGDPARYLYGVARKIYLEYQRQLIANHRRVRCSLPINTEDPDFENMLNQLDEALSRIPKSDRELILSYYTGSGRNKINHRRALAQQCGLGPNALRLRVFRIRKQIKQFAMESGIPIRMMGGPR
jgi:DNA-directed RNA polymerase specialized sigma24 family protein